MLRSCFFVLLFCFELSVHAQQLVLPGDNADPSIVKIGDTYWASATTSNWMPAFPMYKSKDLVNWKLEANVFTTLPSWADYYFWAPEISYENGKVYIYYSAHKKGGNLCVGIASADKPEGPYKDHGPIVCQEVGSIDAFPMRDENGKLFLIWKEDANSVGKPTAIWIQELNEDRTKLLGQKKELFRNNESWERNLVEGVSMLKHGGYYYAFYAAAGCCGAGCTYQTGVARSKSLMGPWEKYEKNPVISNEGEWKCPGHGTPMEKDGRFYFMYHAYDTNGNIYNGRQGLIKEFRFTQDNWIEFINEPKEAKGLHKKSEDEFSGKKLSAEWQWSVFQNVRKKITGGNLELFAMPSGAFLAQKTYTPAYSALVEVDRKKSTASAGLALIGDEKNMIAAFVKANTVQLVQVKNGKETVLSSHPIQSEKLGHIQMEVRNGKDITFSYGHRENKLTVLNRQPIDGAYLPPWDRALRVGVAAKGKPTQKAVFEEFEMHNQLD
ncbi:MAG: glycoside hydrolase [Chitinophagaceae bacterium]|nr:MAG: glycoside hydrolase [Chitinophagaceae bacterium]